ncbi:MAG: DUF1499 domain-containing protein [Candidatus Binatia bacterium]
MKIARRVGMVLVVLVVVRVIAGCFVPRLNINDVTTGATPEYPELQPQAFAQSTDQVFDAASAVARAQGWDVIEQRTAGVIQAVATTPLMHFKDDVTITISHDGTQTKVVVRSHSRVGKGDLGTNARRIKLFQEELAKKVG